MGREINGAGTWLAWQIRWISAGTDSTSPCPSTIGVLKENSHLLFTRCHLIGIGYELIETQQFTGCVEALFQRVASCLIDASDLALAFRADDREDGISREFFAVEEIGAVAGYDHLNLLTRFEQRVQ
jgi:hypothetical protein